MYLNWTSNMPLQYFIRRLKSSSVVLQDLFILLPCAKKCSESIQYHQHFLSRLLIIQCMLLYCPQQFNSIVINTIFEILARFNILLHGPCTSFPNQSICLVLVFLIENLEFFAFSVIHFELQTKLSIFCSFKPLSDNVLAFKIGFQSSIFLYCNVHRPSAILLPLSKSFFV